MKNSIKLNFKTKTNGKGLWSSCQKELVVSKMELHNVFRNATNRSKFAGELRVFFSTKEWDINKLGLIYTDKSWLTELKHGLTNLGFSKQALSCITYSEQGMQGNNYVSLDAGSDFIKEFTITCLFGKIEEY